MRYLISILSICVVEIVNAQFFTINNAGFVMNGNVAVVVNNCNIENNGTMYSSSEDFILTGDSPKILKGTSEININNLSVDNTEGYELQQTIKISGVLTFTEGVITTSSAFVDFLAGSSYTGADDNSFVNGAVKKTGNTDFVFPVGKDTVIRPISISSLSGTETFTAEYYNESASTDGYDIEEKDPGLEYVSSTEYWNLSPTGTNTAIVTLTWENSYSGEIVDYTDLVISHWDGTSWEKILSTASGSNTEGTITSNSPVTSFSPFTI